jgi:hypothetical protein
MKIAMKCSQEQFDAIKGKLVGYKVEGIGSFEDYAYLVNYRFGEKNHITNYTEVAVMNDDADIFHKWNEKIFLNACGIETGIEVQFYSEILDEWLDLSTDRIYRLKPNKKQEIENQILELQNQLKNL